MAAPAGRPPARTAPEPADDDIPAPPALYAEPRYIGSHAFVGRAAQLATLNDWAAPADAHPVLLFEAIGGTGKSMLTWEWITRHAPVRGMTGPGCSGTPSMRRVPSWPTSAAGPWPT